MNYIADHHAESYFIGIFTNGLVALISIFRLMIHYSTLNVVILTIEIIVTIFCIHRHIHWSRKR